MGLETGALGVRWPPGILLLLLVVISLIGLGAFAYFASTTDYFPGEVAASVWVQSWRASWLDVLTKTISLHGNVAAAIAVLASVILYLKGWRAEGILLLVATIGGRLIGLGLKEVVGRARPTPELVQVLQESDSYSFPSGHVMHYVVFFGTLVFILGTRMKPGAGLKLVQGAFVFGLLVVGLARIYLGAHWLSDVVAGYAFGSAVIVGTLWFASRWMAWDCHFTGAGRPSGPPRVQVR